ncbi:uncharacterized protein AB675_1146 [Cyphellophora attinorum]|uniref:Uncharacterized protein n=1 Tax=Cyphellophora attinorum TaxID=1664694 RepID=A0A0N1H6C8_9EURO|nr:uncharacterized protein AB675_1146 [Phialophora attinorum]KPI38237.1 hypothetical protein AB675_1146 [Phialophora attinorum]
MPPKTPKKAASGLPGGEDVTLTARNIQALGAALRTIENFDVKYKAVGEEIGITNPSNAQRGVREALKKLGLDTTGGKIYALNDEAAAATPTKISKTAKSNRSTKANGQKRNPADKDGDVKTGDEENIKKPKVDAEQGDLKKRKIEKDEG